MRVILKKDKRGSDQDSALKDSEQKMLDKAGFKHRTDVRRDFFLAEERVMRLMILRWLGVSHLMRCEF